jgi:hypothetical protein
MLQVSVKKSQPSLSFKIKKATTCRINENTNVQTLHNTAVFLRLDSAKGCQGFRETKMRDGERVILAVLNLCVRNEIRTNHSVIDNTQVIKSVSRARH